MNFTQKIKQPTKFLPIKFKDETEAKIKYWEENNIFYGIFPTSGDSMTCDDKNISIENKNKILISELDLKNIYEWGIDGIPMNKPLCFVIENGNGVEKLVCKIISFKDFVYGNYTLSSYNHKYKPVRVPMKFVKRIFEVHEIIKD
ncbi:MAG: hypothetical protein IAE62_00575 [Flavobacteriales bacterium]|nr:hypothetical protein [Flavobacteriales bacterium]